MNNSWNLKGDASTYKKYDKGWANEEASKPAPEFRKPPAPVQRSGQMSGDNPMVTTNSYYDQKFGAGKQNIAKAMYSNPPMPKEKEIEM